MELCSMLCGSVDGKGVWGENKHMYMYAELLCHSPETTTTSLISYTPTQNGFGVKNIKQNKQKNLL